MLAILLLFFALAQGQGGGTIRGQILIPSARASERIPIVLQRADGPIVGRTFSDTLGNYEFRGLPAGVYEVLVSIDGYEDVRQTVSVSGGGFLGVATLNIPLNEKRDAVTRGKADAGDTVDIAELSRKYPRRAVQDYEKAQEENRKGNIEKAAELLIGAVKLAPDFYAAHNALGTIHQKANRYREAEVSYRRARELNPRSAEPLTNLGSLFIQEAETRTKEGEDVVGKILDSALDILDESIKIRRSARAYYLLGTAYYRSSFYEEGEINLKLALQYDSHPPATRIVLANLYIKRKQWADALTHLDAYLVAYPNASDRAQISEARAKVAQQLK